MSLFTEHSDGKPASLDNQEYVDLKKFIFWVLATLIPLTVISITVGIMSGSLTIFTLALNSGASLVLHIFNMVSIIVILRRNAFKFPYGTGKLENFSGILYATIIISLSIIIIHSAVNRYLHPPLSINLGLAQIPVVLVALRALFLWKWASRIGRKYPDHSPMTHSYYVNHRLSLILNTSIICALLVGFWFSSFGYTGAAISVDTIVAVCVALYIAYCAYDVLKRNFKSLIDLPLPEADQQKILKAIITDFDNYEGIGTFYTQLSGSTRFVQMELYFKETTTVEEIESLRLRLEERLREYFPRLVFHLIPLIHKP